MSTLWTPSSDIPFQTQVGDAGLLRIATAGSVDDGKSTLVGRLLYDSKAIHQDQLEAMERLARRRGDADVDLSLLTDGLRAEREQGITIDVAYRYFSTPRRKFIIADTPGHVQYTRNMVTGASTADLAIVLVDARKGVVTQSRRHGFLSSLLRIPHILVAVNKMDLVGYREEPFQSIVEEYTAFARRLPVRSLTFIPISALKGDNVVQRSERMPWYKGPSLLEHLESAPKGDGASANGNLADGNAPAGDAGSLRLPVQLAVRPHQDFRGIAGMVASGRIAQSDAITVLPAGRHSRVRSLFVTGEEVREAGPGDSVVLTLDDALDVGRGDMVVHRGHEPQSATRLDCTLCWLGEEALDPRVAYSLQHTTRETPARIVRLFHRINVDTLREEQADTLLLNEIGNAQIEASYPLLFDTYEQNRSTGSFILVDPRNHNTVAAGLIRGPAAAEAATIIAARTPHVVWERETISRTTREERNGHAAAVLWFTGLSGAGKSTIARLLEERLFALGVQTLRLDGDNLRHGLNGDLGFGEAGRRENIRRVAHVARLAFDHGQFVLSTLISPFQAERDLARALLPQGRFLEIYVRCDLAECRRRDPKGLYARAERGEITQLTGVSSPYEEPSAPEIVVDTDLQSPEAIVETLLEVLRLRGLIASGREG